MNLPNKIWFGIFHQAQDRISWSNASQTAAEQSKKSRSRHSILEGGLEGLHRRLIKSRASLHNILNNWTLLESSLGLEKKVYKEYLQQIPVRKEWKCIILPNNIRFHGRFLASLVKIYIFIRWYIWWHFFFKSYSTCDRTIPSYSNNISQKERLNWTAIREGHLFKLKSPWTFIKLCR